MKAKSALQIIAGITVMFSTFLLLFNLSHYKIFAQDIKYAFSSKEDSAQTSILQQSARVLTPPQNVIEGFFDVEREGDMKNEVQKNGEKVVMHYRAIQSDKIKESDHSPTLKLQVYDNQLKMWMVTEITRVDKEDGTVYFLLKTENEEYIEPNEYYTGTYQLIFE